MSRGKTSEVMVSLGITEENICLLVRDRRDNPICRNSLRKDFKKELETGATKLNAKVGHFLVARVFGTRAPDGCTPSKDERVRGRLGELFLKARLGWRETDWNEHEGRKEEWPPLIEDIRSRIAAKIDRLAAKARTSRAAAET